MKRKVYIAGPMTGKPQYNFPLFDYVARYLDDLGAEPVNPAEMDRQHDRFDGWDRSRLRTFKEYMQRDLPAVMECDDIIMLPGWSMSPGATLELRVAKACGLQVYFWNEGVGHGAGPDTVDARKWRDME